MGNAQSSSEATTSSASKPDGERRIKICQEILATEETYVRGLTTLDRYFRTALLEAGVSASAVSEIFSSVPDILRLHYDMVLPQLQLRCTPSAPSKQRWCVARVFIDFASRLDLYSTFINNYEAAVKKLIKIREKKKHVSELMDNAKVLQETNGLDFFSLFITIVQRLPRYVLLLSDLIKHVPAKDKEHALLLQAKDGIAAAAEQINDKKRAFEEMASLGRIARDIKLPIRLDEPGRRILDSADVQSRSGGASFSDSHLWLFSDALLVAEERTGLIGLLSKRWKLVFFGNLKTLRFEQAASVVTVRSADADVHIQYLNDAVAAEQLAKFQQARLDFMAKEPKAEQKRGMSMRLASFFS